MSKSQVIRSSNRQQRVATCTAGCRWLTFAQSSSHFSTAVDQLLEAESIHESIGPVVAVFSVVPNSDRHATSFPTVLSHAIDILLTKHSKRTVINNP